MYIHEPAQYKDQGTVMHQARPLQVQPAARVNDHPRQPRALLPRALTGREVLQMQRTLGNHATGRLVAQLVQRQRQAAPATLQRQGREDEEPLQGTFATVPCQDLADEAWRQGTGTTRDAPTEDTGAPGHQDNPTGLPETLKAGMEHLSGMALDDVHVHYHSAKPAQVQVLAYTQGTEIYVGPGQEQHLPHKAWHVVQQKQGRVRPTLQAQGMAINDETALEHEADVMGTKAVQMRRPDRIAADAASQTATVVPQAGETRDRSEVAGMITGGSEEKGRLNFLSIIPPQRTIGAPGDKDKQEADRVPSQVVNQIHIPTFQQSEPSQAVQRQEEPDEELQAKPSISDVQRSPLPTQVQLEAKPEEKLQTKSILQGQEAIGGGQASTDLESSINDAREGGTSLEADLQQAMGQAMGADFSGVKVHTDSQADQLNQSIQARAFMPGQDGCFQQGEYQPGSRGRQKLIAHELTHVVQQNGGGVQRSQSQNDTMPHLSTVEPSIETPIQQQKISLSTATSPTQGMLVQCKVTIGSDKYEDERAGRALWLRLSRNLEMIFGKRAPEDVKQIIQGMATEGAHTFASEPDFLQYVINTYGEKLTSVHETRRRGARSHWTTNPLGRATFTTRVQQQLPVQEGEHRRHVIPSHILGQATARSTSPLAEINKFNERWSGQASESEDARATSYRILHNNLGNLWIGGGGENSAIGFIQSTMFGISDSIVKMADLDGNVALNEVFDEMKSKAQPTFSKWQKFQIAWDSIITVTTGLLESIAKDGRVNVVDTADVFTDIANSCALDLPASALTPPEYSQKAIELFEAMHKEGRHHEVNGTFDQFMKMTPQNAGTKRSGKSATSDTAKRQRTS
jgi:hypothetical protein